MELLQGLNPHIDGSNSTILAPEVVLTSVGICVISILSTFFL
jgi:hypothetical protein